VSNLLVKAARTPTEEQGGATPPTSERKRGGGDAGGIKEAWRGLSIRISKENAQDLEDADVIAFFDFCREQTPSQRRREANDRLSPPPLECNLQQPFAEGIVPGLAGRQQNRERFGATTRKEVTELEDSMHYDR
jgi:hypothetical protein